MRESLLELFIEHGERDFPQAFLIGSDRFYDFVKAERAGYICNHYNGLVCLTPKGLEYLKNA